MLKGYQVLVAEVNKPVVNNKIFNNTHNNITYFPLQLISKYIKINIFFKAKAVSLSQPIIFNITTFYNSRSTLKNKSILHKVLLILVIKETVVKIKLYSEINLKPLINMRSAP